MPKKVHLQFLLQQHGDQWVVDLWNTIDGEPLQDGNRLFDTKEEALEWCEKYRPGRYPVRTINIWEGPNT